MRSRVLAVCSKIRLMQKTKRSASGFDERFAQMKTEAILKDGPVFSGKLFLLDNMWGYEYTNLIR